MYLDLATSLRDSITNGEFLPGQLLASEHDLARRQKVSRVTVRRASDVLVQEGLVERRAGKGLFVCARATSIRQVQVVAGNLAWEPCLLAGRGAQEAAREVGAHVQFYDAHGNVDSDLDMIRRLPEGPAQGAIIISLHSQAFAECLYELKSRGFPFVLVDQRLHDIAVSSVVADNYQGGRLVAESFLTHHHRRIAFIGDLEADTVQSRLAGLRDAISDAGLHFDRSLVIDVQPTDRLGDWTPLVERRAHTLLARSDRPTAVFASCDAIARGLYAAAAELKLRIPADLSVFGFDDDTLGTMLTPPLSSVRQPFEVMGRSAFALLKRLVENPTTPIENQVLSVTPVLRGSLADLLSPA